LSSSQRVAKSKSAKIFTLKLSLKGQNICIKPVLKPYNTYNIESAYLGTNVKNCLSKKEAQNVPIVLGYFIFAKNHIHPPPPPKVAKLATICPFGSP
jgi:hypothetical protein